MSRYRNRRFEELTDGHRADLIRCASHVMAQCRAAHTALRPFGPHYRLVDTFADAAMAFASAITDGAVDFMTPGHSSSQRLIPKSPEVQYAERARDLDQDVAEAIALYGGDAVAAVRALMILTRFFEDERERFGSAMGDTDRHSSPLIAQSNG